jgi:hypothetical protein
MPAWIFCSDDNNEYLIDRLIAAHFRSSVVLLLWLHLEISRQLGYFCSEDDNEVPH